MTGEALYYFLRSAAAAEKDLLLTGEMDICCYCFFEACLALGDGFLADFVGDDFLETDVAAFLMEVLATDALVGEMALIGDTLFMMASFFLADLVGDFETDFIVTDFLAILTSLSAETIPSNIMGIAKPRPDLTGEVGF